MNGKSPWIDRISNEMIKHSFEILKNCLVKLFNLIISVRYVPNEWCKGLITPVHKSGDLSNPDNFRPICALSCLCRLFTNLSNSRLYQVCKTEKLIHVSQIGFIKKHRTTYHIFSLKTLLYRIQERKETKKMYASFKDFKKAYDSVWHEGLFTKLESLNIKGNFLEIIKVCAENHIVLSKFKTKLLVF